jgi:hypothetical protein
MATKRQIRRKQCADKIRHRTIEDACACTLGPGKKHSEKHKSTPTSASSATAGISGIRNANHSIAKTSNSSDLSMIKKTLMFIIDLPVRFILALLMFTFTGGIGWLGLILIALRFFGVILWPWWVAALPLEYGVLYSLYMTIDGALYRAGLKGVGRYAQFTQLRR